MRGAWRDSAKRLPAAVGAVREHWRLKALAVVFAAALWLFVVGERRAEIGFLVPIELRNIPPGTVVSGEVEREAQVRLVGPQTLLAAVSPEQVRVPVDVSRVRPGRPHTVQLTPALVSVPRGVQLVRVSPPEITVQLEPLARRRVPVELAIGGRPASGLEVKGWHAEPPEVEIVGAARQLDRVRAVETQPVDLAGVARDIVRDVPLAAPPAGVRVEGPDSVRVQVRVGRVGS